MQINNVKWELGKLLEMKKELRLVGRELEYHDDNRIKELRQFLDSQHDENAVVKETNSEPQSNYPF